jgi:hypothetical protein
VYFGGALGGHVSAKAPTWTTDLEPLDRCPPKSVTEKAPHYAGHCRPAAGRKRAGACDDASEKGMPRVLCNWCGDFVTSCREEQASQARLDEIEKALNDPQSVHFLAARECLEEERAVHAVLEERTLSLRLSPFETDVRIRFGLLDFAVGMLITALLLKGKPTLATNEKVFSGWGKVYGCFVVAGTIATLVTLIYGGIIAEPKMWVGLDSFHVRERTWSFSVVSILGGVMMLSQPVAILWRLSDTAFVPAVEPTNPRGDCGVGSYVTFLHGWTMIGAMIALIPVVLWLRYVRTAPLEHGSVYLMPAVFGLGVVCLLDYRLVRNAIVLRERYRTELTKLGATTAAVENEKPAPDPTISFIGEDWWKLPSLLGGILFAVWAILEWTGSSQTLIDAMR